MTDVTKHNEKPVYAYPRLSKTDLLFIRIGGNGLGNLLLTWARCLARVERSGWKMIWPTWHSFKPKNWRVNPFDHRTYSDLFHPTGRYVSGWRKPLLLAANRWMPECDTEDSPAPGGVIVEFRGMDGMFTPFLRSQPLVTRELLDMSNESHLKGYRHESPAPISIHVRRGDFIKRASGEETTNQLNSVLPLDWYMQALEAVRSRVGTTVPAFVFSDGEDEELAPLTAMPGVTRVNYGSALADMLALSRSRLLIASGSTFSMWGTYLGQVPTIWHPGKLLQPLLIEHPELEIEWAAGDTLPDWVRYLENPRDESND